MNVQQYIIDALRMHKTVGVLGLGTFFVEHNSAIVEGDRISPPGFAITFERKLAETDLVVNAIATGEGCSLAVAKEEVYKFSNNLLSWLQDNDTYVVGAFGSFTLKNGRLEFTATPKGSAFGLPRNVVVTKQNEVATESSLPPSDMAVPPEPTTIVNPLVEPETEQVTETPPEVNPPDIQTEPVATNGQRKWMWPVITVCVLLAGLLAYFMWPHSGISPAPAIVRDSVASHQTEYAPRDSIANVTALKPKDSVADSSKTTATVAAVATGKYAVIGAAIQSKPKTLRFINSMKKLGLPAQINTHMPGKLYKVSLGNYNSHTAAQADLPRIKALTKIKGLYVYPSK